MVKLVVIIIILALSAWVGAFLWPYNLNTWRTFAGKEPGIVAWQGALLGFCPVSGQLAIPFAVITWVLMLFLN